MRLGKEIIGRVNDLDETVKLNKENQTAEINTCLGSVRTAWLYLKSKNIFTLSSPETSTCSLSSLSGAQVWTFKNDNMDKNC